MIQNNNVKEDYPSLYDSTGNILDLNTCLVHLSVMRRYEQMEKQMEKIFPAFVAGIAAIYVCVKHSEVDGNKSVVAEKWSDWCGGYDFTFPEDGDPTEVINSGVAAMEAYLQGRRDAYQKEDCDKSAL